MARETNRGALAGRILNEQYVLIGLLGVGGMAEVYRGDDLALERDLAVKVLPGGVSDDPAIVARFRDEARRVAALSHPRVVPVYHLGDDQGLLYIVMPLMRGSLRDLLRREGTLPPAEAARLVGHVAEALEAAHAAGLIHRDVKPENILLDADGNANLSDFGIARSFTGAGAIPTIPSLANGGIPAGTPQYMAPEQLAGEPLDQRADVYGLAAVLYELLAGEPPHGMGPIHEVIGRAIAGGIPPLTPRAPAVWPQLEAVVAKGLATDRDRRYQTVRDFARALTAAMNAPHQIASAPEDLASLPTIPAAGGSAYPAATRLASNTPAAPDASTVPMSPAVASGAPGGDGSRPRGRLALAVALFVLLALLTTASGAYYLANAGRSTAGSGGTAGAAATQTTAARATANPARTATPHASPTGPASGTPSATATAGTPAATTTPALAVTVAPQPFALQPDGKPLECSGTQTVTNNGSQAIDWSWSASSTPLLFQYAVSGSGKTPSGNSMPLTRTNEPAGATDQISVKMTCGQSITVHFTATLANDPSQSTSFDFQLTS